MKPPNTPPPAITSAAVLDLLAGLLHELRPAAYDSARHPVGPAATHDARTLLAALRDHGVTVTTSPHRTR